jgi:hypothetical protein
LSNGTNLEHFARNIPCRILEILIMPNPVSPNIPKTPAPATMSPEKSVDEQQAAVLYQAEDPFDARPADPDTSASLIEFLLAWVASHVERAAQTVKHALGWDKLPSIKTDTTFDTAIVSAPFDVKKNDRTNLRPLEMPFFEALDAKMAAQIHKDAFVQGADLVPDKTVTTDDEKAFSHYLRAWREQKGKPGRVLVSSNFEAGARRISIEVLKLNIDRKSAMQARGEEYWLVQEEADRLQAAATMLSYDEDPTLRSQAKAFIEAGPVPQNSAQQASSFLEWQAWKADKTKLPPEQGFSLDAAVAYATTQIARFTRAEDLKNSAEKQKLVNSATDLIANKARYELDLKKQREEKFEDDLIASLEEEVAQSRAEAKARRAQQQLRSIPASLPIGEAEPVTMPVPADIGAPPPPPPERTPVMNVISTQSVAASSASRPSVPRIPENVPERIDATKMIDALFYDRGFAVDIAAFYDRTLAYLNQLRQSKSVAEDDKVHALMLASFWAAAKKNPALSEKQSSLRDFQVLDELLDVEKIERDFR